MDDFDYEVFDFKVGGKRNVPPGFVIAYDPCELDEMLDYANGKLPEKKIRKLCKFDKGCTATLAYTLPIPDDYEIIKLDNFTHELTNRFHINIGCIQGEKPINSYSQRLVLLRSGLPPVSDLEFFIHHDNETTTSDYSFPNDTFVRLYPLVLPRPVTRAIRPVIKIGDRASPTLNVPKVRG